MEQHPHTRRHELITETSRMAFRIEAAEREAASQHEIATLRVEFHRDMAELLALTPATCPEAAVITERTRQVHLELMESNRQVLADLEEQAAVEHPA